MIRNVLETPFAIAAGATGYEGFALSKEESDPLVPQADYVLARYMPQMGPHGALIMFSLSLAMLAGTKAIGFNQWKKKNVSRPPRADSLP